MPALLIGRFIGPVLFVLGVVTGYSWRDKNARLEQSKVNAIHVQQLAHAQQRAQIIHQTLTERLNQLAIDHETAQQQAQQLENDISRRINAGTLRLRQPWRAENCDPVHMPKAAATAAVDHENTANRTHLAAAIIRAGIEADNQLKACQQVIREYQTLSNE